MSQPRVRVEIAGGEARCFDGAVTEQRLEVERHGRVLRGAWDPRDTDVIHYASVETWTDPAGAVLTPEEREWALDALWSLAAHTGLRAVVTYEGACLVARRWDRGAEGQLVEVRDTHVDILELGRTARIPATRLDGPESPPVMAARIGEATWMYPASEVMTEHDRERLEARLARSGASDQRISAFTWRLQVT